MIEDLIKCYEQIILKFDRDTGCPRWATYEEKMREFHMGLCSKEAKKKVEKKIQEILKESGMSREEYNEVLNVAKGFRSIGQSELLVPTPLVVATPKEEVTIVGASTHIPSTPYDVVSQVQLVRHEPSKEAKDDEEINTQM